MRLNYLNNEVPEGRDLYMLSNAMKWVHGDSMRGYEGMKW